MIFVVCFDQITRSTGCKVHSIVILNSRLQKGREKWKACVFSNEVRYLTTVGEASCWEVEIGLTVRPEVCFVFCGAVNVVVVAGINVGVPEDEECNVSAWDWLLLPAVSGSATR
uniref:Uncharacterized protein n=1 Tax=Rhizophora mucronata TaxID=61149 RepID=A0A2P2MX52_RHIMU